jgi:hypothetical protein
MNEQTLKQFCDKSAIEPKLIRAVVRQFGGWKSFCESAKDVASHGIDGGFGGFIYYSETESFARRNRALIATMASAQADDMGMGVIEMIRGFGCFRNGTKPTDAEIGSALYAGKDLEDGLPVLNALAWYAGEEVCRSYVDLIESEVPA